MANALEPALTRDLSEAKAALTRHAIVIIRAIETDLEPAIMSEAKSSMASLPSKLNRMDEDELDRFSERLRKASHDSVVDLRELYVRLMAKLGTESYHDLAKELYGIEQLFKWGRIARAVEPVNERLAEKGFDSIKLEGPEDLSESFELELDERWPPAFAHFKSLVEEAAKQAGEDETPGERPSARRKGKKPQSKE